MDWLPNNFLGMLILCLFATGAIFMAYELLKTPRCKKCGSKNLRWFEGYEYDKARCEDCQTPQ